MAERIRVFDWAPTPLGPIEEWPQSLKTAVDLLLPSGFPMIALWGPQLIQIYNDAYRNLMGRKHPAGLGQPTEACWPEVWHINKPIYERVWAGETLMFEHALYPIARHSALEDAWFTLSYSPLKHESGAIAGVLVTALEVTAEHKANAALRESQAQCAADLAGTRRLYDLYAKVASEADLHVALEEIVAAACEFTRTDRGCIQLVSDDGERLEMFAFRGYDAQDPFIQHFLHEGSKPACDAARRSHQRLVIEDVASFPGLASTTDREIALADGIRATQSTPMVSRKGETIGVLSTQFRVPHRPRDDELRLVDLLAWAAANFVERYRADQALRESEERFRQFGEASSDLLWIRDAETLCFEYLSPAFETIYGERCVEALGGNDVKQWAKLIYSGDRKSALDSLGRVRRGERVDHEFRIVRPFDGAVGWVHDTDFPLFGADGRVERIGGIARDITDARRTADRMQVLVAELQHRTRNLIGVIRSVADRTLAGSESLPAFRERFRDRLDALARVNGLLSRLKQGERVAFDELLYAELSAHGVIDGHGGQGRGGQVRLSGPPGVRLRSGTVQTFALALHELATNALKHGALSRPEGRLGVTWSLTGGDGGERLRMEWRETGVRPAESLKIGYGRELIEQALPYQLHAETTYRLTPDGVFCVVVLPISSTHGGFDHASNHA